jgi:hypothetical protein
VPSFFPRKWVEGTFMTPNETITILGSGLRTLLPMEILLPLEIQVALLRIALREVERHHYSGEAAVALGSVRGPQ